MKLLNLLVALYFLIACFSSCAQNEQNPEPIIKDSESGLLFQKESEHRADANVYTHTIQLKNLSEKIQALQFRILFNKADDDSTILIFKDIQRGSDLKDPAWLLDYNIFKDSTGSSKASKDEIYVVLYNSNLNGGLLPGSYSDLIKINYEIANMTTSEGEIKSSIKISHAEASTFNGNPVNIKPTRDELKIYVSKK
jgi:hypothetical protein